MEEGKGKKRLNKFISETGVCSRREADRLIEQGRVTVNGKVPELGQQVDTSDTIMLNGQPLKSRPQYKYLAFNKPVGITCTTERHIKGNIIDYINYTERIFPIGRLDKPSEGLIFLTNNGDIINKILRAGNNHEKEYLVTVDKPLSQLFIKNMSSGVPILGIVTKKCLVTQVNTQTFKIVLTQGLNRQIRRMCSHLGYTVVRLKRTRIMNVELGNIAVGKYRELTESEMNIIFDLVASSINTEEASVDYLE